MVYKYFFDTLMAVLLSIHLKVELLDHKLAVFLFFGDTTALLSTTAPFCIPTNSV